MPDSARQQVRLRRFLLASAFSVLYLVVLSVFRFHDGIDRATLLQPCTIVALLIVAFSILFVSRLNLRFADPSLTAWQLLASVFTMLYIAYRAPDTRLAFVAFAFVAFMFAMLRHSGATLAVLASVSLLAFAAMIGVRYATGQAARVIELLANPERARRMGEAGRQHATRFTVDRMIAAYEALYDRLLAQERPQRPATASGSRP